MWKQKLIFFLISLVSCCSGLDYWRFIPQHRFLPACSEFSYLDVCCLVFKTNFFEEDSWLSFLEFCGMNPNPFEFGQRLPELQVVPAIQEMSKDRRRAFHTQTLLDGSRDFCLCKEKSYAGLICNSMGPRSFRPALL